MPTHQCNRRCFYILRCEPGHLFHGFAEGLHPRSVLSRARTFSPCFGIPSIVHVSSQPRLWFPFGGCFFLHRNRACWWLHTNVIHCARDCGVGRFIKRNTTLALYLAIVWDANCVNYARFWSLSRSSNCKASDNGGIKLGITCVKPSINETKLF